MSPIATNNRPSGQLDAAFLEGMFQGAGIAIVACQPDGQVVTGNAAALRLFNAGAPLPHVPVVELFPEAARSHVAAMLERLLAELEPLEFRFQLEGGSAAPYYGVWFTPVFGGDGALQGVTLWFRDVTERVQLSRTLKKRERLASLGGLSGAVAHHYNNLLCCIATSVEYAINMNTVSAMRRALQRTADAVGRGAHVTRQLLLFAQADHRERSLCDFTEAVLWYFDEHEERLAQRGIKLLVDWQLIPILPLPRELILIVLGNIVDNAVEAMPQGGALTVTLARRDASSACLSIADTGCGISPMNLEHIFEPFYTTKGELGEGAGRNAGMGLAVAHGLVGEMHGTITAANVPGRGARFDIVLPLPRDERED